MENNWETLITTNHTEARMIAGLLENSEIPVRFTAANPHAFLQIVSASTFGNWEVAVLGEHIEEAKELLAFYQSDESGRPIGEDEAEEPQPPTLKALYVVFAWIFAAMVLFGVASTVIIQVIQPF